MGVLERLCKPLPTVKGTRGKGGGLSAVTRRRSSRRHTAGSEGGLWGELPQRPREDGLLICRKADEFHAALEPAGPLAVGVSVAGDCPGVDDARGNDHTPQHNRKLERPAGVWTKGVVVRDAGSDNADLKEVELHESEHSSAERPGHLDSRSSASVLNVGHGLRGCGKGVALAHGSACTPAA